MTDDLISRADAIKAIKSNVVAITPTQIDAVADCIECVESIPSAQPKTGKWIAKTENYHSHWVCSICGGWALLEYNEQMCLSDFCPNCGAIMKGENNE